MNVIPSARRISLAGALFLGLSLQYSPEAIAAPAGGPLVEPYSVRPNILDVAATAHDLLPTWDLTKRASLEAVAFLLEAYPKHDIYFLARDAEVFYDAAVLATEGRDRAR